LKIIKFLKLDNKELPKPEPSQLKMEIVLLDSRVSGYRNAVTD